jgi:isoquinoline 1-oxidoreductase beta subunit
LSKGGAKLDRRTLLIGGGVGVGLVVAFALWPRNEPLLGPGKGEQAFNHFLKIGSDGRVTVAVPQAEYGQGVWTALPQLLADELGASWEMVAVEPAPLTAAYGNPLAEEQGWLAGIGPLRRYRFGRSGMMRITAGSTSVRAYEEPLRRASAAARAMLIAAAARRWGVAAQECDTADGLVRHGDKSLPFALLAEDAATIDSPANVALREAGTGTLAGNPLSRLDLPAKSDGSFRFAGDVRLPDMLFASVWVAPPGGRIAGFDKDATGRPGVRALVDNRDWLAVVGDNWWAANEALEAAAPRIAAPSTADAGARLQQALKGAGRTGFAVGDYDQAIEGSRPLSAFFSAAPAQQLGLEPLSATARFSGDRCEVWAATQAPEFARAIAEQAAGGAGVTLYPMPVGDSGGRAIEADVIPIAIALARRLGKPVQATLSASMSQAQGRPGPAAAAEMRALLSPNGGIAAWKMRIASESGMPASLARSMGEAPAAALTDADLRACAPAYAIPNAAIDAIDTAMPFAAGYCRGGIERAATFFSESFIDELAKIAGVDALLFRMGMLGGRPRLARCLSSAATLGGWDGGGPGSTMGLAAASLYGSRIGLLAEATVGDDQRVKVHRLVATVDCGRIVNPSLVKQQVEGGLLWALGTASAPAAEFEGGMVKPLALSAVGLPRIGDDTQIRVELVGSKADPGGVSGLGVAVLAPAIANAIAAGTGRRLRSLPLDPMASA